MNNKSKRFPLKPHLKYDVDISKYMLISEHCVSCYEGKLCVMGGNIYNNKINLS